MKLILMPSCFFDHFKEPLLVFSSCIMHHFGEDALLVASQVVGSSLFYDLSLLKDDHFIIFCNRQQSVSYRNNRDILEFLFDFFLDECFSFVIAI